jgi:hypothetical protein
MPDTIKIRFFKDINQIKEELLQTYNDNEYGNIYDVDGNEVVGVVKYEFARHELRNISINGEGDLNGILVDDGYGKKIWKTWAEYRNQ